MAEKPDVSISVSEAAESRFIRRLGWMVLALPAIGFASVLARREGALPTGAWGDLIVTVAVWLGTIPPIMLLARARRHLASWELWSAERRDMAGWTATLIASVACGLFAAVTVRSDAPLAFLYLLFAAVVVSALGAQITRIRRSRRDAI